jgi:hypothetical protein
MQHFGSSNTECSYDALCYAQGKPKLALIPPVEQSLPEIVSMFSLFVNAYQFKVNSAAFIHLLTSINLKYDNENNDANYLSKDYTSLFLQAISSPQFPTKLCDVQDQLTLTAIFSPLLVAHPLKMNTYLEPVNLSENHYADLIRVYDLSTASNLIKAQTLFCLAAVFAKYSSSYIFGRENESPQALRAYAAALMIKTYELDPSVFASVEETAEENFKNLVQKMLGGIDNNKNVVFSCSAMVSGAMLRHAQQQSDFKAIANKTKPPSW